MKTVDFVTQSSEKRPLHNHKNVGFNLSLEWLQVLIHQKNHLMNLRPSLGRDHSSAYGGPLVYSR